VRPPTHRGHRNYFHRVPSAASILVCAEIYAYCTLCVGYLSTCVNIYSFMFVLSLVYHVQTAAVAAAMAAAAAAMVAAVCEEEGAFFNVSRGRRVCGDWGSAMRWSEHGVWALLHTYAMIVTLPWGH
jgi:hypothetical protein